MTSTHIRNTSDGSTRSSGRLTHENSVEELSAVFRLEGPALPPNGTPTRTRSLERLNERLEHLAFGRRPEGFDPPPLETYTTTATEHGDVVRATSEYVRWFRRTYSVTGPEDRVSQPSPRPAAESYGGETDLSGL